MSILGNNLLAQYYAQNQGLPFDYEAVEYLEGNITDKPYIDTCVYLGNTTGYLLDYQVMEITGGSSVFGCGVTSGNVRNWFGISYNANQVYVGWNTARFINEISEYGRHVVIVNLNNDRLVHIDGIQKISLEDATVQQTTTAMLFRSRNGNSLSNAPVRLRVFSCKVTDDTDVVRNFIPCVRKSDGKPGLYDLCKSICPLTGTPFYINAGTGEFVTP